MARNPERYRIIAREHDDPTPLLDYVVPAADLDDAVGRAWRAKEGIVIVVIPEHPEDRDHDEPEYVDVPCIVLGKDPSTGADIRATVGGGCCCLALNGDLVIEDADAVAASAGAEYLRQNGE